MPGKSHIHIPRAQNFQGLFRPRRIATKSFLNFHPQSNPKTPQHPFYLLPLQIFSETHTNVHVKATTKVMTMGGRMPNSSSLTVLTMWKPRQVSFKSILSSSNTNAPQAYEKGYNDSHEDADSVFSAGFKAARDKNGTLITALAWSTALFGVVSLGYSLFWIHRAVERKIQRKNAIKYGHAEDPKVMV